MRSLPFPRVISLLFLTKPSSLSYTPCRLLIIPQTYLGIWPQFLLSRMTFPSKSLLILKTKCICYFLWKTILQFTQVEKNNFSPQDFYIFSRLPSGSLILVSAIKHSPPKTETEATDTIFAHNRHLINVLWINDSATPHVETQTWQKACIPNTGSRDISQYS